MSRNQTTPTCGYGTVRARSWVHHKFDLSCTCMGGGSLNTHWNVQFLCEPCGIRLIIPFHEHNISQISKGRNSVDFYTVQRELLTFIILTSVTKVCLYVKKKNIQQIVLKCIIWANIHAIVHAIFSTVDTTFIQPILNCIVILKMFDDISYLQLLTVGQIGTYLLLNNSAVKWGQSENITVSG